ncbi:uncharacterized protein rrp1 isoform 2-T2 [Polymixia lowei]
MAPIQEPEIQFAQRLASNEKPIRTKAIKKLRNYISVRSQKTKGGFTSDELLKLWKGLFYCLWMQDKPLLQEELSNQISGLIHNFQSVEGQFLFLQTFLQTVKREWTGIDRLRMDKFFQLVRFVFRQTFEVLKRKDWDTSVVSRFLELLTAQVLQSDSGAPCGLQFHILDLYMTELAGVGTAELTADQNLTFIEPFCKMAAKTKDQILFRAICSSIFSTIIDQAPFAIQDLMRELKAAETEDSDSGQASEEEEEEEEHKTKSKPASKNETGKHINGNSSNKDDDDDDEEEEDELLHLEEDSDTELPDDGGVGPVLQFDYGALADKLFELASRGNIPSYNRQRLYKIIKVLRDLREGIFPQDEYPEEVSTDEDDDEMFGSRKRMKRGRGLGEEEEQGGPAAKKAKGKKKEASKSGKQTDNSTKDDNEPAESTANDENNNKKKKKKRKKKKAAEGRSVAGEEKSEVEASSVDTDTQKSAVQDTEKVAASTGSPPADSGKDGEESKMETSTSSVTVTEAVAPPETDGQSQTTKPLKNQSSVTVTEEACQPEPPATEDTNEDQSETLSKKKRKKRKKSETSAEVPKPSVKVSEAAEEQPTPLTRQVSATVGAAEPDTAPEADATTPSKKTKKKKKKVEAQAEEGSAEVELTSGGRLKKTQLLETAPETTTPAKKTKKSAKAKKNTEEVRGEAEPEEGTKQTESLSVGGEASTEDTTATPLRRMKKKTKQEVKTTQEEETVAVMPSKKNKKAKEPEEATLAETPQEVDAEEPSKIAKATPAKKKKKKQKAATTPDDEVKGQTKSEVADEEPPADEASPESEAPPSSLKKPKKRRKIPVVFEYEVEEPEAAMQVNGLAQEETTAKKAKKAKLGNGVEESPTPLKSKKSQKKKKDFISFQTNASIPTPLFCKSRGSPSTPLSSKKSLGRLIVAYW